jgi:hypothetical protein
VQIGAVVLGSVVATADVQVSCGHAVPPVIPRALVVPPLLQPVTQPVNEPAPNPNPIPAANPAPAPAANPQPVPQANPQAVQQAAAVAQRQVQPQVALATAEHEVAEANGVGEVSMTRLRPSGPSPGWLVTGTSLALSCLTLGLGAVRLARVGGSAAGLRRSGRRGDGS